MTNPSNPAGRHPVDPRQHLQTRTDVAMGYLLRSAGARSRRAVLKQVELLIHLSQATIALEYGRVTRASLSPQKRALCLAPVRAIEPQTDLEAVRRYVHAMLLGADESTLRELVRSTRSAELIIRFERIAGVHSNARQLELPKTQGSLRLPHAA